MAMYIVMGATGHVGSAVAETLLEAGQPVTIDTHDAPKGEAWRAKGAEVAVADAHDSDALRQVFRGGTSAFILNPLADISGDTDAEEQATVESIVEALTDSGLKHFVVASTYGAQVGDSCGDLTVLYKLEKHAEKTAIPHAISRGAYYFSNWDASLRTAREDGVVYTLYPDDHVLPMVAPADLGVAAAKRLLGRETGLAYVEGPTRYCALDVADAFASALGRDVRVQTTPREKWVDSFLQLGFSQAAAESYTRMTEVSLAGNFTIPDDPTRGTTTLKEYIDALVKRG